MSAKTARKKLLSFSIKEFEAKPIIKYSHCESDNVQIPSLLSDLLLA